MVSVIESGTVLELLLLIGFLLNRLSSGLAAGLWQFNKTSFHACIHQMPVLVAQSSTAHCSADQQQIHVLVLQQGRSMHTHTHLHAAGWSASSLLHQGWLLVRAHL